MFDDLLDEASAENKAKSGYAYGFLRKAAESQYGLGTFEMRDDTKKQGYDLIDLVDINRG